MIAYAELINNWSEEKGYICFLQGTPRLITPYSFGVMMYNELMYYISQADILLAAYIYDWILTEIRDILELNVHLREGFEFFWKMHILYDGLKILD
jgi:hypothetical protein